VKLFFRIIAVIFGVVLVLPGLCTLLFGGYFTFGSFGDNGLSGAYAFGVPMILVGGFFIWLGWLLITRGGKG
jgi:hypothetical protein